MIIKTITCHDVYNHGATLQAFALMRYLQQQGHDVEIIDYKPDYLSPRYALWLIGDKWKNRAWAVRLLYLAVIFPTRLLASKAKIPFALFKRKYMRITRRRYASNGELRSNPPIADAYIAGSDQIWNTLYRNGRDPAFYLDFAPEGSKKIAYAASFAVRDIAPEYRDFVRTMIENIDFISVRESSAIDILDSLGIDRGNHVVDPVFLLDRNEWAQLGSKDFSEKYILVYDFEQNPLIEKFVKQMAREKRFKIYAVNNYGKTPYANKDFNECGPRTFLALIRNAELVVSNSFHATAFSIIFEKQFYVFNRIKQEVNTRMRDLLVLCRLESRLVLSDDEYDWDELPVNYAEINENMIQYVVQSKEFLNCSLNGAYSQNDMRRRLQ